jgi:hypothetical protein
MQNSRYQNLVFYTTSPSLILFLGATQPVIGDLIFHLPLRLMHILENEEPIVEVAPLPCRLKRLHNVHNVLLLDNNRPSTYEEEMVCQSSKTWLEATRSGLKSMANNYV